PHRYTLFPYTTLFRSASETCMPSSQAESLEHTATTSRDDFNASSTRRVPSRRKSRSLCRCLAWRKEAHCLTCAFATDVNFRVGRSEEHTSELQSLTNL